ncbi:hypothetical protein FACS1894159_10100 [Bacteroidia bacterium]|nr:hypothetical protein FACS1894159_10100 [Bacteroidia bacterium]
MATYLRRVFAYIVKIGVLIGLIYLAMTLTHTTAVNGGSIFAALFCSTRGMILMALLLALALANPRLGFTTRHVALSLPSQREAMINALATCGYSLASEEGATLTFRAESPLKRAVNLWDEAITVKAEGNSISVSGVRREVARAVFRMETLAR